ncbi:MAG TPA: hypothetical protein VGP68_00370 [Gemmataceae bacterium]|jgi:hypothetical protein|nr:hypothetical protein [Gemmataceae bacterium]
MTVTSNADFAKLMMLLARPAEQFRPTATYDPDGDCIEFLAKPEPFYGERVDDLVTVYYSQETNEVIGSLIKGVAHFCSEFSRKNPGFSIIVKDGPVRLEHLFLARMWSFTHGPMEIRTLTYQKLIEVAGKTVVEGELCFA